MGGDILYLWDIHFGWICDCSAVKEVLDYKGTTPMVFFWAQELLGYHFTIIHRSNKMMVNVDALTRSFGHLLSHHIAIADLLRSRDHAKSNRAYETTKFSDLGNVKITKNDKPSRNPLPLLISDALH